MPISIELAQAVLSNVLYNPKKRQVTPERIARAVSDYYSVPMDVLQGQKRDKAIVMPRQIAMFLMREETDVSLLRIGAELGGRDHSTVLHACDKITARVGRQRRASTRDRRCPRADLRRLTGLRAASAVDNRAGIVENPCLVWTSRASRVQGPASVRGHAVAGPGASWTVRRDIPRPSRTGSPVASPASTVAWRRSTVQPSGSEHARPHRPHHDDGDDGMRR